MKDDSRDLGQDRVQVQLGALALQWGLITQDQLRNALAQQAQRAAEGTAPSTRLGDLLVEKRFITPTQLETLLSRLEVDATLRAESAPDRQRSSRLGKYEIVRELGRGGMGVVFEAVDTDLNRPVALKMLLGSLNADTLEQSQEEERFVREARLSAGLPRHPHIVGVYEAGAVDGKRFIAMEYVEGREFSSWRRSGSITLRQQIVLLRDVAVAVDHAHRHGIVHRDLKPANVLVDASDHPHVTDFGLARMTKGPTSQTSLTASGQIMGTPAYMSPEQAEGRKGIDRRTDVYSLGVMLYEILTGRPPFRGSSPIEILMKVVHDPVVPPSSVIRTMGHTGIDPGIERICLRALAKAPADRYPNARSFADDLTRWLKGEEVPVAPAPQRSRRRIAVASAAAALSGVLLLVFLAGGSSAEQQLRRAASLADAGRFEEADRIWDRLGDHPGAVAAKGESRRSRTVSATVVAARRLISETKYEAAVRILEKVRHLARKGEEAEELLMEARAKLAAASAKPPEPPAVPPRPAPAPPDPIPVRVAPERVAEPAAEAELVFGQRSQARGMMFLAFIGSPKAGIEVVEGRECLRIDRAANESVGGLQFTISPGLFPADSAVEMTLDWRDLGGTLPHVVYDSTIYQYQSARMIGEQPLGGEWRRSRLLLLASGFQKQQGGGSDFLVNVASRGTSWISRIALKRIVPPATGVPGPVGLRLSKPVGLQALLPGLVAEGHATPAFAAALVGRVDSRLLFDQGYDGPWGKSFSGNAVKWTGYLVVPKTARYVFQGIWDENDASIQLDDEPLFEGRAAPREVSVRHAVRNLEQGAHRFVARYVNPSGLSFLHLSGAEEGAGALKPLGPELLFHLPSERASLPADAPDQAPAGTLLIPALARPEQPILEGEVVREIESLLEREDFEGAAAALERAGKAVRASEEGFLAARVADSAERVRLCLGGAAAYRAALRALEKSASDRAAMTIAGRFRCLLKGDWTGGLLYLSEGSDSSLATLAKRELRRPSTGREKAGLGDEWWSWSERQMPPWQDAGRERAGRWYREAGAELDEASRARLASLTQKPRPSIIDLLPLVDPARDAIHGSWSRTAGGSLHGEGEQGVRIEVPWSPAEEYDFRVVFTRHAGTDIGLMFAAGGAHAIWQMGAWDNKIMGFSRVGGQSSQANSTGRRLMPALESGKVYVSVLKVRKGTVSAYVNGKLISEWKASMGPLSIDPAWTPKRPDMLGLGIWTGRGEFHRAEVLEVRDRRPAAPVPEPPKSTPETPNPSNGWISVFDGKTLSWLADTSKIGWKIEQGAMVSVPSDRSNTLSRERFPNGELRMVFEPRGVTTFWFQVRHAGPVGYQVWMSPDDLKRLDRRRVELLFSFRGDALKAQVDGNGIPVQTIGASKDGHFLFHPNGGEFRIHSVEFRP